VFDKRALFLEAWCLYSNKFHGTHFREGLMMSFINSYIYYIASFGLVFIGLFILIAKQNLIKMIIGINIADTGVNLFLISLGYIRKGTAPVFSRPNLNPRLMVDPVPHALVLTAIVIGVAVLALALSLAVRLFQHYRTLDMRKIKEQRW